MAKKKKSRSKRLQHNRSTPTDAVTTPSAPAAAAAPGSQVAAAQSSAPGATVSRPSFRAAALPSAISRWGYVRRDLRRLAVIAVLCVAAEVIVWLLFNHTGLGNSVYGLVKL